MNRRHNLSAEDTLSTLESDRNGLSAEKARERLQKYGRNELTAKGKIPWPVDFLRQFASPLIYILLAAAVIEILILRKPTDAAVILVAESIFVAEEIRKGVAPRIFGGEKS